MLPRYLLQFSIVLLCKCKGVLVLTMVLPMVYLEMGISALKPRLRSRGYRKDLIFMFFTKHLI